LSRRKASSQVHWRLLTTHQAAKATDAWQIVDWYRRRWTVEQFFRVLKSQGFRIEDSQLESADTLLKPIAVAAKAAAITLQLVQARDGRSNLHASVAFDAGQIKALDALHARYHARTPRQKQHTTILGFCLFSRGFCDRRPTQPVRSTDPGRPIAGEPASSGDPGAGDRSRQ